MSRRAVTISLREVGQRFAVVAVVRDAGSGRKLAEGREVPYGFTGAAMASAEALCAERGWTVAVTGGVSR